MSDPQPIRLLLIEDDPVYAATVAEVLESAACHPMLEHRTTLAAGLERLRDNNLDALLLDLTLPDSAGIETLRTVRAAYPYLPVVVLTGMNDSETERQALAVGAQEYLPKDKVTTTALRRLIEHAIERERARFKADFEAGLARFDRRLQQFRALGHVISQPKGGAS